MSRAVFCRNLVWIQTEDGWALTLCGAPILPDLDICAACASAAVHDDHGRVKPGR